MDGNTPLGRIGILAVQDVKVTPTLRHLELFTRGGLLTVLWHGPPDAEAALIACGGAMGGLLGPGNGLYQFLGDELGAHGIATLRVSYRRPNDLEACVDDAGAACEMAVAEGARSLVIMGHSFGGAVAINCAAYIGGGLAPGVVTLATQSAGCEIAPAIADRELLMIHGGRDELLPVFASEVVKEMAGGGGELVIYPSAGHLLTECASEMRELLPAWITRVLGSADS
jgi:pimeloyl-ACP methyl ester carboxylesterase